MNIRNDISEKLIAKRWSYLIGSNMLRLRYYSTKSRPAS